MLFHGSNFNICIFKLSNFLLVKEVGAQSKSDIEKKVLLYAAHLVSESVESSIPGSRGHVSFNPLVLQTNGKSQV